MVVAISESGVLAAHCSKVNKEAQLVEGKVCFILDASIWVQATGAGWTPIHRLISPDSWLIIISGCVPEDVSGTDQHLIP